MRLVKATRLQEQEKIPRFVLLAGLLIGLAFFIYYYMHQLTLAHYDAKAHMLVARRIVDSLQPGYAQMGVNWPPLIHLVYLPFIIFDSQYRSGLLPSLISVCSFALSGWLVYRISYRMTGSVFAGVFAAAVLFANPNLEYLQSCPLTEPLFMFLFLMAIDRLILWRESDHSTLPWQAAVWTSLSVLCRYEGWLLIGGILLLLLFDGWTKYIPRRKAIQSGGVFLSVFGIPMAAHFGCIYWLLGDNFFNRVAAGHPNPYFTYNRPVLSVVYHLAELSQMAAIIPLLLAAIGLLLVLFQCKEFKRRLPLILLWLPMLINIAALYWGLVYRLRYSVLLLPAVAIFGSLVTASKSARSRALLFLVTVVMVLPWLSWYSARENPGCLVPGPGNLTLMAAGLVLFIIARVKSWESWALLALCVLGMQLPPLAREDRPMMVETMEHEFIEPDRQTILQYLRNNYDGRKILIDMGKQAPLVYDSGLPVKEFVYNEGGDMRWHQALENPERQVGWLCSETGDAIWEYMQVDPHWAGAYALAVKTKYLSLYHIK
jgi:hypothetical protein